MSHLNCKYVCVLAKDAWHIEQIGHDAYEEMLETVRFDMITAQVAKPGKSDHGFSLQRFGKPRRVLQSVHSQFSKILLKYSDDSLSKTGWKSQDSPSCGTATCLGNVEESNSSIRDLQEDVAHPGRNATVLLARLSGENVRDAWAAEPI